MESGGDLIKIQELEEEDMNSEPRMNGPEGEDDVPNIKILHVSNLPLDEFSDKLQTRYMLKNLLEFQSSTFFYVGSILVVSGFFFDILNKFI